MGRLDVIVLISTTVSSNYASCKAGNGLQLKDCLSFQQLYAKLCHQNLSQLSFESYSEVNSSKAADKANVHLITSNNFFHRNCN